MNKGVLIILFALLSACASSEKNKDEAQLRLSIGTSLLSNGNYPAALSELLKAEKQDPTNPAVQNNLGLVYLILEHPADGYAHLKKAIEIAPTYTEARNNLARVEIEMGLYDDAIRHIEEVLKDLTYPSPEKAWVNLGLAYFSKREYGQSTKALRKALEIDRNNCLAYNFFGRSQFEMAQYNDAAKTLDQATKACRAAKFDEPHYYSALSYYKLGQKEQALARLDELLSTFPHGRYNEKASAMRKMIE